MFVWPRRRPVAAFFFAVNFYPTLLSNMLYLASTLEKTKRGIGRNMKRYVIISTVLLLQLLFVLPVGASLGKGLEALKRYDFKTVIKEWKPLAEKGNSDVQSVIAVLYHTGQGVKQNYKKAFYWYKKAAESGNVAA